MKYNFICGMWGAYSGLCVDGEMYDDGATTSPAPQTSDALVPYLKKKKGQLCGTVTKI
jgi:hypothetical protein